MLPGPVIGRVSLRITALAAAAAVCVHCGNASSDDRVGAAHAAIVQGSVVESASPVLFLRGPEGFCTAVLIAPNLVATARHCVAPLSDGNFGCTAAGELQPGTQGGQLGPDNAPGTLNFYSSAASHIASGIASGPADAVGARVFSLGVSGAPTACRDDIAFVILDRNMTDLDPAPVRLDTPTPEGELISLWGYGFTDEAGAAIALRVHNGAQVLAVGPDTATDLTQPAPVRAIRVGPGSFSCNGDSGGPVLSAATGAVIALVSLGVQVNSGLYCTYTADSNTTGPRLAAYRTLALAAFAAAGASPIPEAPPGAEGGTETEGDSAPRDAASISDTSESDAIDETDSGLDRGQATGGGGPSCSLSRSGTSRVSALEGAIVTSVLAGAAIRRRGRTFSDRSRRLCLSGFDATTPVPQLASRCGFKS